MVGHNGTDTIGLTSGPKTRLYPSGNIYANSLGTSTTVPASGSTVIQDSSGYLRVYVSASSQKYKDNIISYPTQGMDDLIRGMRPVTFNYKAAFSDRPDEVHLGLIAEEVSELFPEFVNYNDTGEAESLNYTRLSVLLLQTVKELSDKIKKLETK